MTHAARMEFLARLQDVLQSIGETRFAELVSHALSNSEDACDAFLVSNIVWGGAGSIADQAGTGRVERRTVEAALIALGEQQITDGRVNPRTSMWVTAFTQWRRDGI